MTATIVDVYAGPGGWSAGIRALGLTDIGIELDAAACLTRAAAGHLTIRADVATMPLEPLVGRVAGLIMSPPCQSFSTAGNGEGRDLLDPLCQAVADGAWWAFDRTGGYGHVLEVGRWAETLRPTWIACEQVPTVLPVWRAYAYRWRALGWSTWAGILNAADYGVPQTRRRAFLLARPDGRTIEPPAPTHCMHPSLFGDLKPRVTMLDALGWGAPLPARTLCGSRSPRWLYPDGDGTRGRMVLDRRQAGARLIDPAAVPAPTLTGGAIGKRVWTVTDADGRPVALTLADALTLQGFRPDYPVQGTRTQQHQQVADAVPPPLAAGVVAAVTGTHMEAAA